MAKTRSAPRSRPSDPIALASAVPGIREKLERIRAGEAVRFEQVTRAAQGFVAALIARQSGRRVWVVTESLREQERLHLDLLNWVREVVFVPEFEIAPVEGAVPDPEMMAERLAALERISKGGESVVLTTFDGFQQVVPDQTELEIAKFTIRVGQRLDRDRLVEELVAGGYETEGKVSLRGQLAVRGGILDIYSWQHGLPVRIELFGDEVESIREFELDDQRSVKRLEQCELLRQEVSASSATCHLYQVVKPEDCVVNISSRSLPLDAPISEICEHGSEDDSSSFFPVNMGGGGDWILQEATRADFEKQIAEWIALKWSLFFVFQNEGEEQRFRELYGELFANTKKICHQIGSLSSGFTFPKGKIALICDAELFGRYKNVSGRSRSQGMRSRFVASRQAVDFSELSEGELVVHLEHGIGRFEGLRALNPKEGALQEVMVLEFADEARLYIPLEQAYLVSRYVGIGKKSPPLSAIGETQWQSAKRQAERSIFEYANRMLEIQAARETKNGFQFPADNRWQQEFESAFLYKETQDQIKAIADTKDDMESHRPMDRLICGDVGFGKTEVAIRAAFKSVMGGKQVALLVPTTVLAQQHFQTFRERMADYPVVVDMLSRFRTPSEQRHVIKRVADGSVDILVGTHRLISNDVRFKDLGLVIVDEEQRFGVKHKERLKERFHLVDMLTLSATPIPRTLYLALTGAKDMSTIETPPPSRVPVETMVCGYDERIIRDAIQREMKRGGQVYFLHNRIDTIFKTAARIESLCPRARVLVGHGQMDEEQLEEVMRVFVNGEADVLVSTTIIESGLDIPNANTIIIDRADRFGLADLYQLRGRVGRSNHKAYAYLLLPRELGTKESQQRINAIKQYSSLGAGFRIAMRDLEIRGAGNILGTAQSGHITAVGFDLYCQMLKQTVAKIKGEKASGGVEVRVRMDFLATSESEFLKPTEREMVPAFLPVDFIRDPKLRVRAYKELAEAAQVSELETVEAGWRDRFGRLPEAVENLLLLMRIKIVAASKRVDRIDVEEGKVKIWRSGDFVMVNGKFPRLTSRGGLPSFREVLTLISNL